MTVGREDTQETGRAVDVQTGPQGAGRRGRKMIADAEAPHGSDLQAPENTLQATARERPALASDHPVLASDPLWSANPLLAPASVPQHLASALLLLPRGLAALGSGHPLPGPSLAGAPPGPQAPILSLPVVQGHAVDHL